MELGPTTGVAALMALAATRPTVVGGYAAAFAAAAVGLALTALAVATLARRSNGPVEAGSTEGADPTKTTSAPERTNRTKEYSS